MRYHVIVVQGVKNVRLIYFVFFLIINHENTLFTYLNLNYGFMKPHSALIFQVKDGVG